MLHVINQFSNNANINPSNFVQSHFSPHRPKSRLGDRLVAVELDRHGAAGAGDGFRKGVSAVLAAEGSKGHLDIVVSAVPLSLNIKRCEDEPNLPS